MADNFSTQLSDLAIIQSLLLQRVSNGLSSDVANVYSQIIEDLTTAIRGADNINARNMNATIKELKERFDVDVNFLYDDLEELAITESAFAANAVNATAGVDIFRKLPPESTIRNIVATSLMSSGQQAATIKGWLKGIDAKMLNDIEGVVGLGIVNGSTNSEIANSLNGILTTGKGRAEAIARTAVSHISNEARMKTYEANSEVLRGYERQETLDSNTCIVCGEIDGKFYPIDGKRPPSVMHINCRGINIPTLKTWEELGLPFKEIPVGTRSSIDGNISGKIDFDEWLKGKDEPFIKKWFGTTRYKLYKENKLTLSDFVTNKNQIISVSELRAKYS